MVTRRMVAAGIGALAAGPVLARPRVAAAWNDGLDSWLEAQRLAWRVPGLAVALIKDGGLAYLKSFGHRDGAGALPVTTDTLFRGASTTKALGAASVAVLVDEGKLDWDAPVTRWLPEFAPGSANPEGRAAWASINLRDMLSHRTGLPRHDLVWYNNTSTTRAELVGRIAHLPMSAPLRARYQYNNLMFVMAGHVVERVTGQAWEDFATARLLAPLGMRRAGFSVTDMAADPDHAVGHAAGPDGRPMPVRLRRDALLGPAGALNASISDYARWAAMQLGRGSLEGRRILSPGAIAAMWEPLLLTAPTPREPEFERAWYGLGWRIDSWQGMARVAHGGDLNGFTSRVTLLPQRNAAIVVLANVGDCPLPNAVTPELAERMLGLPSSGNAARALARRDAAASRPPADTAQRPVAGTSPSRPLAAYSGSFRHPGYGTLRVSEDGGALAARYNDMPARLEHWHYDVFETRTERLDHGDFGGLKLVFQADETGALSSVSVRMEDATPPVVFTREA